MPNDYKLVHAKRNASKIEIEGVDTPRNDFVSHVPAGYTSPDVEDKRNDLANTTMGKADFITNPMRQSK